MAARVNERGRDALRREKYGLHNLRKVIPVPRDDAFADILDKLDQQPRGL